MATESPQEPGRRQSPGARFLPDVSGVRSGLQRRGIGSFLMLNLIGRLENYAKLVGGRFITTLPDHEDPERRRELVAFYKQFDFRVASRFNNLMVRKLA